jgi:hypothetical protein
VKKVLILAALPAALLAIVTVSCARDTLKSRNVVIYENDGAGEGMIDDVILENDFLEVRFLPQTAEIILIDKAGRGGGWRSNPPDAEADPGADTVTKQLMQSQFSLQYSDAAGVGMTLYSGRHSVEKGMYNYAVVDSAAGDATGSALEVNYTVGNVARDYQFPIAAPEKRMVSFLEKIERGDRRKVEASYRLYDIDNLRSGDDKSALLAMYPDLAKGKVYVLRDNTQEYMREQIEEFFAAAGYTYDDFREDASRYNAGGVVEKPVFNVTVRYALDGNSLVVSVPFDKIAWRTSYPITQLTLLPFMGAGGLEDSGYLVVPDGSGALISFNNGKQNQIAYNNNLYGWDEAMPRDAVISDNRAPFPVFGIQKNGAALLCVIEEGSAYASVRADVSGRNSSYNSVYAQFAVIHGASMDISGKSDKAVYLYEAALPAGERIVTRFTPCTEDGYVGMAKEYRSYLLKTYPGLAANAGASASGGSVPIAVEIVGAVNKTQHRLGIPFDLPLKLTSYTEAEGMIRDFADFGWRNVRVKLIGWFNGSVDHTVPSGIKLIGALGGKRGFKRLVSTAKARGFALYVEADFLHMRDNTPFDGFSLYRDAARYVSRERVETYPYSFVWFGERKQWGKLSYLARPAYTVELIDKFVRDSGKLGVSNFAFRTIGSKLAGDYNEKRPVSREASMKGQQAVLAELKRQGKGVLVNTGYAYAAPYADSITDIALSDQGFGIIDAAVPFYQIALHGLVPYTGRAINLAEDYTKNLLDAVEGGAGLYFSFMTEETAELQETKFRQFYANEYGKWVHDADTLYQKFARDFGGLYNQAIVSHEIVRPKVRVTGYEDGAKVVVNAGEIPWEYQGVIVGPGSYAVIRQGE